MTKIIHLNTSLHHCINPFHVSNPPPSFLLTLRGRSHVGGQPVQKREQKTNPTPYTRKLHFTKHQAAKAHGCAVNCASAAEECKTSKLPPTPCASGRPHVQDLEAFSSPNTQIVFSVKKQLPDIYFSQYNKPLSFLQTGDLWGRLSIS